MHSPDGDADAASGNERNMAVDARSGVPAAVLSCVAHLEREHVGTVLTQEAGDVKGEGSVAVGVAMNLLCR